MSFLFAEVGIDCHGCVDVCVAKELLRGIHINVRLKQDGGVAVPERMGGQRWFVVVDNVGSSLLTDPCFWVILDESHLFAVMQPAAVIGGQRQGLLRVIPVEYVICWFCILRLLDRRKDRREDRDGAVSVL